MKNTTKGKTTFKFNEHKGTTEVHACDSMNIKHLLEEFGEHSFEVVKEDGVITELHTDNLEGAEIVFSEKF